MAWESVPPGQTSPTIQWWMQKKQKLFIRRENSPESVLPSHLWVPTPSQGLVAPPGPLAVPTLGVPVHSSSVGTLEGSETSSTARIRSSITAHSARKSVTFSGSRLSQSRAPTLPHLNKDFKYSQLACLLRGRVNRQQFQHGVWLRARVLGGIYSLGSSQPLCTLHRGLCTLPNASLHIQKPRAREKSGEP